MSPETPEQPAETPPVVSEQPAPVDWTRELGIQLCREEAVAAGTTARAGEACGIAEGGLNLYAARCAWPRPPYTNETGYMLDLIAAIERDGIDSVSGAWDGSGVEKSGRQAWDELLARCWADVSFGPCQITVQHADAFGDGSPSFENVTAFRQWTIDDPRGSIRWAMRYLASKYDPNEDDAEFKALCRYNWPAGGGAPFSDAVAANYRRALDSIPA